MPLVAGDKLGPYEISMSIGAGGMGEVYKAVDTRLNRVVAIKTIDQGRRWDRFHREAHCRRNELVCASFCGSGTSVGGGYRKLHFSIGAH
jgi:serine/threonine protein kinase